ncbi:MAG TPA: 2-hydroxyacid dehydrogenase [Cytophagaceae bacterium]|nr:2-hydroxyacid dehydrogenase [Cytophagaceae bacterium]
MKTAIFSTHKFEKDYLVKANGEKHLVKFIDAHLSYETVELVNGHKAVSIFVNDDASSRVLHKLKDLGVQFLALRSAGFNNVDIKAASEMGIRVARVPEYSPYAVAEHATALMLALNRKLIKAHSRVRDSNFSLDGLAGFDMHGKTAGVIGLGKIGRIVVKILNGYGCKVLAFDITEDKEFAKKYDLEYVTIDVLCEKSDIITLHVPLNEGTKYLINKDRINKMKPGVMLINTGRGGLLDTKEVIKALKICKIGYLGLDVYEEEQGLFFEDHSDEILQDDVIARLMTFQNVLITSHQAFLTDTALQNIADTTIDNLDCFEKGTSCKNELK